MITVGDGILDVVRSGVDKDSGFVPSTGFDPGVFVDGTEGVHLLVADGDAVLGQQGHRGHVARPDHVTTLCNLDVAKILFLLNVKKSDTVSVTEQQHTGTGVKDFVAIGCLDFFSHLILQVLDDKL
jgi:hypothetical protein